MNFCPSGSPRRDELGSPALSIRLPRPRRSAPTFSGRGVGSHWHLPGLGCGRSGRARLLLPAFRKSSVRAWSLVRRSSAIPVLIILNIGSAGSPARDCTQSPFFLPAMLPSVGGGRGGIKQILHASPAGGVFLPWVFGQIP